MEILLSGGTKANMALITELAKKLKINAMPFSAEALEAMEDAHLAQQIEEGMASGFADTDEVLRKLGLK